MTDSEILDLRDDFVKRKQSCGADYDEVDFIGFARAVIAAQLAATAAPAEQNVLWVPVKEHLAPRDTDLLLTISTGKVVLGMWHSDFGWDWADTGEVADEEAHVTHWRLFPMAAS